MTSIMPEITHASETDGERERDREGVREREKDTNIRGRKRGRLTTDREERGRERD